MAKKKKVKKPKFLLLQVEVTGMSDAKVSDLLWAMRVQREDTKAERLDFRACVKGKSIL